ncbi:MAG TPA: Flp family type IVb pilin [Candidatus Dormibacteraeota bacterium]|nr:Flp family type IVb pilin [Candidatus Dormibacteraeota bacterium]
MVKLSGRIRLIHLPFIQKQKGQGMVEYALILALIALVVVIMLITFGHQLINVYSNIVAVMCNYKVGC